MKVELGLTQTLDSMQPGFDPALIDTGPDIVDMLGRSDGLKIGATLKIGLKNGAISYESVIEGFGTRLVLDESGIQKDTGFTPGYLVSRKREEGKLVAETYVKTLESAGGQIRHGRYNIDVLRQALSGNDPILVASFR